MRIRTEIPSVGSGKFLQSMLSYVQINIYNTNLKALRKEGVNLRDLLENVGHRSVIMDVPFLSSETGRMSSIAAKRVIKSNSGSIRQKRSLGVRRASRSFCVRRRHASCSTAEDGLVANKKASSFCIMDLSKRDEMETSVAPQDCVLTKETSGPLTSTPLPEKRPITFENFSKENGFGEAQHSNEPGVDNGEDVPLSCLEVRLCGSNSRDPPIAADAGCDGDSQLFQDCIDESDRTLDVHSCAADPPENLEFAAAVKAASGVGRQITDVNVISHPIGAPFGGSESTSCMPMPPNNVFAEPDAMAEQLSNDQCVAELPAGIVKQEEPSSGDDTITASRSFVSFSQQVMQGLMSVNNDYVTIPHRSLYHSDTAEYLCPTLRSLEHTGGVSTSSKLMLGEPNPTYCSIEIAQTEHMQHEEDPARNYGKVQSNVPEREVDALINTGNALEPSTHEHELWPSASVNRPVKLSPISSKSKSISTSCNSTPHIKGQMTCSAPKRSSPPELTVAADASAMDRNESPPECTSTPKRTRRKRLRASSSDQDNCGAEKNEGLEAVQNECGNEVLVGTEKNMLFRCHMEGCGREILWRPRYGKHRLVEHARTHWTNAVKICKICGFKAPRIRRVYKHHQIAHKGEPYHGAISAETEADMVELLQLWKKCFPELSENGVFRSRVACVLSNAACF